MNQNVVKLINLAKRLAFYNGYQEVSPYWLFHAGIFSDDATVQSVYGERNITLGAFKQVVDYVDTEFLTFDHIGGARNIGLLDPNEQELSEEFKELIERYEDYVKKGVVSGLAWEIIALGALEELISPAALAFMGTTGRSLAQALKKRSETLGTLGYIQTPPNLPAPVAPESPVKFEPEQPMIKKYCKELSKMAEEGEIDPVIGRTKEISRIVQVLGRRRKNNPVILGPAGTGKTAIAEGLALDIHNKEKRVERLWEKRIVMLDMALMLAGTKYRGQFEERLTGLIQELEADSNTIVFLDEIHTLVGAGEVEGGATDGANILKPALARGKLQMIGATTVSEYRMVKSDPALERRFQPVQLEVLTDNEIVDILKGIKGLYEEYHNVTYTDEALVAASKGAKLLFGRNSPDVEIDLLDEAGSRFKGTTIEEEQIMVIVKEFSGSLQAKKTVGFSKV